MIRKARPAQRRTEPHISYAAQPEFGEKLVQILTDRNLPAHKWSQFLAFNTGRRRQVVERWFKGKKLGLPDLPSFARLCIMFNIDPTWLLGLSQTKLPLAHVDITQQPDEPQTVRAWLGEVFSEFARAPAECVAMRMTGNEMEPAIARNALMLVDTGVKQLAGNGLYVLDWKGSQTVRRIETRIGIGVLIQCANPAYEPVTLANPKALKDSGVTVFGQVKQWCQIQNS